MEKERNRHIKLFSGDLSWIICEATLPYVFIWHFLWLCNNYEKDAEKARIVADFLTIASLIERQVYPVNAKYYQRSLGNFSSIHTRTKPAELLNATAQFEVDQLTGLTEFIRKIIEEWIFLFIGFSHQLLLLNKCNWWYD